MQRPRAFQFARGRPLVGGALMLSSLLLMAAGPDVSLQQEIGASGAKIEQEAGGIGDRACGKIAAASQEQLKQMMDQLLGSAAQYQKDAEAAKAAFLGKMLAVAVADEKWQQGEAGKQYAVAEKALTDEKAWKEKLNRKFWEAKPVYELAMEKLPDYSATLGAVASIQRELDALESRKSSMSTLERWANLEDIDKQIAEKKKALEPPMNELRQKHSDAPSTAGELGSETKALKKQAEGFLEAQRWVEENKQRIEQAEKELNEAKRRSSANADFMAVEQAEQDLGEAFDKFQALESRRRGLMALTSRILAAVKGRLAQLSKEEKTNKLLGQWSMQYVIPGDPDITVRSGGTFGVTVSEDGVLTGTYRDRNGGTYPVTGRVVSGALTATATDGSDTYTITGTVQRDPLRDRRLSGSGPIGLQSPKMKGQGKWISR